MFLYMWACASLYGRQMVSQRTLWVSGARFRRWLCPSAFPLHKTKAKSCLWAWTYSVHCLHSLALLSAEKKPVLHGIQVFLSFVESINEGEQIIASLRGTFSECFNNVSFVRDAHSCLTWYHLESSAAGQYPVAVLAVDGRTLEVAATTTRLLCNKVFNPRHETLPCRSKRDYCSSYSSS